MGLIANKLAQSQQTGGLISRKLASQPKPEPILGKGMGVGVGFGVGPLNLGPNLISAGIDNIKNLGTIYGGGEQGIAQKLKRDIQQGAADYARQDFGIAKLLGPTKTAFRMAGDVAGFVYAPIGAALGTATKATGLDSLIEKSGPLFDTILEKLTGSRLTDIPEFQKFAMDYPEAGADFERGLNLLMAGADTSKARNPFVKNERLSLKTELGADIDLGKQKVSQAVTAGTESVKKILPRASNIMNRVARLTPSQAQKFEQMTGISHGEYLAKTGNYNKPKVIIENEFKKFQQSRNDVDAAVAELPGVYKTPMVDTMLRELSAREGRVSSPGAPSPDLVAVRYLSSKNASQGLNMSEINAVKRLYERNVKLDYVRQNLPEKTARATAIDSAVREWQFAQADKLGLKNWRALNKQTQASKFIVDQLGKQITGKTGLNAISITDWILLSGGDPTAISAFIAKRIFGSGGVQAKFAKLIGPTGVGQVKPEFGGKTGVPAKVPGVDYRTATEMGPETQPVPPTSFEPRAGRVFNQSVLDVQPSLNAPGQNPIQLGGSTRATQPTPLQSKTQLGKASPKTTTPTPTVKPVINTLAQEAQQAISKGISKEEWIKGQVDSNKAGRFIKEKDYVVKDPANPQFSGKFSEYALDNSQRMGKLSVEKSKLGWRVRNIFVDDGVFGENLRRKGIATEAYRSLNEQSILDNGKPLRSSDVGYARKTSVTTLSDNGESVWKKLVANGEAEKVGDHYQFKTPSQLSSLYDEANKK